MKQLKFEFADSEIEKYLDAIIEITSSNNNIYGWLKKKGKFFTQKIEPKSYGKMKACYYNSQLLALDNEDIEYYEGYAIDSKIGFPMEHGFAIKNRKVIDSTWKTGKEYFGVKIPKSYIKKHWLENKIAGALLFYYYRDLNKRGQYAYKNI